jgi:hypothetical protein
MCILRLYMFLRDRITFIDHMFIIIPFLLAVPITITHTGIDHDS